MAYIGVVNHSTLVKDADVALMTKAVALQVTKHVAPAWGERPASVICIADEKVLPPGSCVIGVLDDADQAGVLGWHTENPGGVVYGKVFARPVLDAGGSVLAGELSVSSVLSHEVLEAYIDPAVNLWADCGDGSLVAFETCDPVEDLSYTIPAGGGKLVSVSDFVYPAWFDAQAPKGAKVDYLRALSAPLELSPGGYCIKMVAGQVTQAFGGAYAAWRKPGKAHALARTARFAGGRGV